LHRAPRAADAVGRVALWSVSLFLLFAVAGVFTSMAWLLAPFGGEPWFVSVQQVVVAAALVSGWVLFVDLMVFYRFLVPPRDATHRPLGRARVHVALTCYDDEQAIGPTTREFKASPLVARVIVVDNASTDRSREVARQAGADEVVLESRPGYGACCMRALREAARGADVVVLCEGDMTFTAADLPKMLAYLENCDLVLGTRATQELRDRGTQMDWLINPFNQLVAKLHQARFFGTRLTDVGCTYRAMRADAYRRLAPRLRVEQSHFSPHMFIEALKLDMRVVEIPVFFRKRVGVSKGVGSDKLKASRVALAMLWQLFRA
ncbi:MAG TPA: glycosyltransferase family 2 protein, partial [Anaeromyxobacteraceae bacterium]|nr:glycosyltransferase family 2 protein [Anaeromyxobacteraceae bacterium]